MAYIQNIQAPVLNLDSEPFSRHADPDVLRKRLLKAYRVLRDHDTGTIRTYSTTVLLIVPIPILTIPTRLI